MFAVTRHTRCVVLFCVILAARCMAADPAECTIGTWPSFFPTHLTEAFSARPDEGGNWTVHEATRSAEEKWLPGLIFHEQSVVRHLEGVAVDERRISAVSLPTGTRVCGVVSVHWDGMARWDLGFMGSGKVLVVEWEAGEVKSVRVCLVGMPDVVEELEDVLDLKLFAESIVKDLLEWKDLSDDDKRISGGFNGFVSRHMGMGIVDVDPVGEP